MVIYLPEKRKLKKENYQLTDDTTSLDKAIQPKGQG